MFKKHKEKIDIIIKERFKTIAHETAHELLYTLPYPEWTGNYIESFFVGKKAMGFPRLHEPTPPPFPNKLDKSTIDALKLKKYNELQIEANQLIELGCISIAFNNTAGHARFIEHTGWDYVDKKTGTKIMRPPYKIFAKAYENMMIIKGIQ